MEINRGLVFRIAACRLKARCGGRAAREQIA